MSCETSRKAADVAMNGRAEVLYSNAIHSRNRVASESHSQTQSIIVFGSNPPATSLSKDAKAAAMLVVATRDAFKSSATLRTTDHFVVGRRIVRGLELDSQLGYRVG
jgi:hypothetical protein